MLPQADTAPHVQHHGLARLGGASADHSAGARRVRGLLLLEYLSCVGCFFLSETCSGAKRCLFRYGVGGALRDKFGCTNRTRPVAHFPGCNRRRASSQNRTDLIINSRRCMPHIAYLSSGLCVHLVVLFSLEMCLVSCLSVRRRCLVRSNHNRV